MDVERLLAPEEAVAFVVARGEHGLRLDRVLAARLPFASRDLQTRHSRKKDRAPA